MSKLYPILTGALVVEVEKTIGVLKEEIAERDTRISQLERINKALAEECDRLRREHGTAD